MTPVQFVAAVRHMAVEAAQHEVPEQRPVRIIFIHRHFRLSGFGRVKFAAAVAIAGPHRPEVAVDPEAVDTVTFDQLGQLRQHQAVRITAVRAHGLRNIVRPAILTAAGSGGVNGRRLDVPLRKAFAGRLVPDAGVVAVQRQAEPPRLHSPSGQSIPLQSRRDRRRRQLRKPAQIARMPLAVGLHKIDAELMQEIAERVSDPRAELRIPLRCMQIVMKPDTAMLPVPVAGHMLIPFLFFRRFPGIRAETFRRISGNGGRNSCCLQNRSLLRPPKSAAGCSAEAPAHA